MVLQTLAGRRTGEDVDDLVAWLTGLTDCPAVTHTLVAGCDAPVHQGEPATWVYVEADAGRGLARRRCLGCGLTTPVLDSAEHWSFPPMWCCPTCGQSIVEMAGGLHAEPGGPGEPDRVDWLAVAVRCVGCGCVEGVTDLLVPGLTIDEVAAGF